LTSSTPTVLLCKGTELIISAFAHYGEIRGLTQQQVKAASNRAGALAKFAAGGERPTDNPDVDLSSLE